jgi:hypothetical protein
MFISQSGNVGIGTTSPSQKLEINSTGTDNFIKYTTTSTGTTGTDGLLVGIANSNETYILNYESSPIKIFTAGNERMRITAAGDVGIGTTSPFSKFTVLGGASASQISIINSDGGHLILRSGIPGISNNGASFVTADVDGSNQNTRMVISSAGNVGIGTASPAYRLDVSGSIGLAGSLFAQTTSNYNVLYSKTGGAAIYLGGSGDPANYYDNTTHNFRNIGGGTNYATLNSTGLGIGTTSPSTALHIARAAASAPAIRLQTTNSTANGSIQWANSTNSIIAVIGSNYNVSDGEGGLEFATGGTTTRMFISSSGNVGIGTTSPAAKLDIAYSTNPTTATPHIILTTGGTAKQAAITAESFAVSGLVFSTGDGTLVDRMTILRSNGNVGIGTTSPAAKLQVQGNTIISGSLNVTGSVTAPSFVGTASFAVSASWAPNTGGGGVTINNNTDNYLITATGTANTLNGEANLQFNGSTLTVTGNAVANAFTGSLQGTASFAVSASWAPSAGGSAPTAVTFNRVTASYTFALTDAGKTVEVSASAAGTYNLTVPPASTTNFADGTFIDVVLYGTGSIQFVTGSGVTFRSANNWTKLGTRYGAATIINIAGDEWYLIGNLNA